jgi:uncharacterized RDD family membrane protein YckC
VFCPRCGAALPEAAAFCPSCGAATALAPGPPAVGAGLPFSAPDPAASATRPYGGFWRRFWAYALDGIILNVVGLPLGILLGVPWASLNMDSDRFAAEWFAAYLGGLMMFAFLGLLLSWLYAALLHSSARQATLGQMALGLKVTDLHGRRLSFARATGRFFATTITNLTFLIGYVIAAFTARKQTLHDMIAGTLVVR